MAAITFPIEFSHAEQAKGENDTLDVYEFPIRPGMDEWKELDGNAEMLKACQIPENVLLRMTTEGLVKTCLNYPSFLDFMLYSDFSSGIEKIISRFNGLKEMLERPGAGSILLKEYKKFDVDSMYLQPSTQQKKYQPFKMMYVELLLSQKEILENFQTEEKKALLEECLVKYEKKKNNPSLGLMQLKTLGMLVGQVLLSENYEYFVTKYNENELYKLFLKDKIPTDRHILDEFIHSAEHFIDENNLLRGGQNEIK